MALAGVGLALVATAAGTSTLPTIAEAATLLPPPPQISMEHNSFAFHNLGKKLIEHKPTLKEIEPFTLDSASKAASAIGATATVEKPIAETQGADSSKVDSLSANNATDTQSTQSTQPEPTRSTPPSTKETATEQMAKKAAEEKAASAGVSVSVDEKKAVVEGEVGKAAATSVVAGATDTSNNSPASDEKTSSQSATATGILGETLAKTAAVKAASTEVDRVEAQRAEEARIQAEIDAQAARRATIVDTAYAACGTPYVFGAAGPNAFDCSGLTKYCYEQLGIDTSRTTEQQYAAAPRVAPLSEAEAGDILYVSGHVGIYIGGDSYIHAPVPGDVIKVANGISYFSCVLKFL